MDRQPILGNQLVALRPLEIDDFDALYTIAKDPYIWEQHWASDRWKLEVFTKFFEDAIESEGALVVIDKAQNRIIGSSRFQPIPNVSNGIEIGWTFLSREFWGGIYNRSFKNLMIKHAFTYVDDVIFHVAGDNKRSKKAVQKLGGLVVDPASAPELLKDKPNYTSFRIRKSDWNEEQI